MAELSVPLRIFIGYDKVESIAFHTLHQSIINQSSVPVSVTAVKQSMLPMYKREHDPRQSNEFSFTRFLVPYLAGYDGWALFMDCDMMFRADPKELFDLADDSKAVMCCKHDYTPTTKTKFLGAVQYQYPRKNWSSVMLFNCGHPDTRKLTPFSVNTAKPAWLHRMQWTDNDSIGSLPLEWNHLVGEYAQNPEAKNVHWTIGGPYFNEYRNVEHADEWREVKADAVNCAQIEGRESA